jgi:hypothetical protein
MSDRTAADRGERMGVGTLVISALFALVVGGVGGLITTFAHAQLPPWALIAGLLIVVALVLGFRLVFDSRIVAAVGGVGFLAGEVALTLPAAGAPVLALDGPLGWIWAIAPAVLLVAAVAVPWPGSAASRP